MYKLNDDHYVYMVTAKSRHKVLKRMARAVKDFDRQGSFVISSDVQSYWEADSELFEGVMIVDNSFAK